MSRNNFARYAGTQSWINYRRLLQERFDLILHSEPTEQQTIWEGHTLHIDAWASRGVDTEKGTIILVHGAGGHGRLLAPIADSLAALGWRVIAPDLPGYGLSPTRKGWRWNYDDWPKYIAWLADQEAGKGPVALMGLSVGGMTAFGDAQIAKSVSGVIVTTLIDMGDADIFDKASRWPWLGALSQFTWRFASWLTDLCTLPLRLVAPMGALSSDPLLRQYLVEDPLLGGLIVPTRFFRTLHNWRPLRPDLSLGCPVLLVHPSKDTWTPTAMSLPTYNKVRGPKRFVQLTDGAHLPIEQPARAELMAEISTFLGEILINNFVGDSDYNAPN